MCMKCDVLVYLRYEASYLYTLPGYLPDASKRETYDGVIRANDININTSTTPNKYRLHQQATAEFKASSNPRKSILHPKLHNTNSHDLHNPRANSSHNAIARALYIGDMEKRVAGPESRSIEMGQPLRSCTAG